VRSGINPDSCTISGAVADVRALLRRQRGYAEPKV
jgi:hypothetical protein